MSARKKERIKGSYAVKDKAIDDKLNFSSSNLDSISEISSLKKREQSSISSCDNIKEENSL
jgi:hypothetical protein